MSSSKLHIIPYVPLDDQGWIFSDDFLIKAFDKLDEQGLKKDVFWDGTIETEDEFIEFAKNLNNSMQFVFDDTELLGMAWLGPITHTYAFAHFYTYREWWGKKTLEAGHLVNDFWFGLHRHGGPTLDTLIGVIPSFNTHAIAYVKRMNWVRLGEIPDMFRSIYDERDDAVIYYQTRERHGRK